MRRAARVSTGTYATSTGRKCDFWFAGHARAMSNVQSCGVSIYEMTEKRNASVYTPSPAHYYYFMRVATFVPRSFDTRTNREQLVRVATENMIGEMHYTRDDNIVDLIVLYGPHREVRFRNMRMHHFWGVALLV